MGQDDNIANCQVEGNETGQGKIGKARRLNVNENTLCFPPYPLF
jgi:hypothetical protein